MDKRGRDGPGSPRPEAVCSWGRGVGVVPFSGARELAGSWVRNPAARVVSKHRRHKQEGAHEVQLGWFDLCRAHPGPSLGWPRAPHFLFL